MQLDPPPDNPSENNIGEHWKLALETYRQETGHDLLQYSFAKDLLSHSDADKVVECLRDQAKLFTSFRTSGRKVLDVLKPIVNVVLRFIDAGAEGASAVAPGGKAIFVAFGALLQAMKETSQLYDTVEILLQKVREYVERVGIHLQPATSPSPALMRILLDTLVQVLNVLAIVTKYCNEAVKGTSWIEKAKIVTTRRTKDWFRVILDKTDVKDALGKLQDLANAELQVTAAHTNAIVREVKPKVAAIYDSKVVDDLRSWLRPLNPQPNNYEYKRQAGSCEWFFDEAFEVWKEREGGIYWVYGNAGAGKSVLSSSVIDKLMADPALNVAYFYFDFNDTGKQDCRALVSSLVFQVGTRFEDCLTYLLGEFSPAALSPTYEKLLEMLSHLLSLSGRVFLVIDALDECPESARDKGLLNFLDTICNLQRDTIRVLITSRPEPDIRKHLSPRATHSLSFHDSAKHMGDLSRHIERQLSDRDSYGWPKGTKATAQRVLTEKSRGMFLWVDLQLRYLTRCASSDVKRALNELPSGLDKTYERILKTFSSQPAMVDRARHIFECIAFAKRPLSVAEVSTIFFVNFESPEDASSDSKHHLCDMENLEKNVLEKCPGLLDVVRDAQGEGIVQFIHFSVKEYLTSELRTADSPACRYSFSNASADLTLATACLTAIDVDSPLTALRKYADSYWLAHLSSQNEQNEDALGVLLYRFLHAGSPSYARWLSDNTQCARDNAFRCAVTQGLRHVVERMIEATQSNPSLGADSIVHALDHEKRTALHDAAHHGFDGICSLLLRHGAHVDDDRAGETPLHLAASRGHLRVACVLLEHAKRHELDPSALCRARDRHGKTVLHRAVENGFHNVISCLLLHGACLEDADQDGMPPLHLAAFQGNFAVARAILQHSTKAGSNPAAQCRARDETGMTALHNAAMRGNVQVMRLLLEHDHTALLDNENDYVRIPLHLAIWCGDRREELSGSHIPVFEVIRVLMEYKTDGSDRENQCSARDIYGHTALHYVVARPDMTQIIRYLLCHGAPLDAVDYDGQSLLHTAASEEQAYAIRLLLERNSDNESTLAALWRARGIEGQTPLHLAVSRNDLDSVRLLLDYNSNDRSALAALCRVRDKDGRTPLHKAVSGGKMDAARLLLDYNSNDETALFALCCVRDNDGQTPLHWAVSRGSRSAIRLLLDCNSKDESALAALCHARDKEGRTPLHMAVFEGTLSAVRLLLEYNSKNESALVALCRARDKKGSTALHYAAKYNGGSYQISRELLDHGALVDDKDVYDRTPFHVAASEQHLDVIYALLEHPSWDGSLDYLIRRTFKMLYKPAGWVKIIPCGIDDHDERTLLHHAVTRGRVELLHCLLAHGGTVDDKDIRGLTPLHLATSLGHVEILRCLLDHGATIDEKDINGLTPLHLATTEGRVEILHCLLDHGARLDNQDTNGLTPLHLAASLGKLDIIRVLLEYPTRGGSCTLTTRDIRDAEGRTALHHATSQRHTNIIRYLVDYGAPLEDRDTEGRTPLHLAASHGDLDIMRILLEDISKYPSNPAARCCARDMYGRTALHTAASEGHTRIVRQLLSHGASHGIRDEDGQTALHFAALHKRLDVMCALLEYPVEHGFDPVSFLRDLEAQDPEEWSKHLPFLLNHHARCTASPSLKLLRKE